MHSVFTLFSLLCLLAASPAFAGEIAAPVVQVTSRYADPAGAAVTEVGTGVTAEIPAISPSSQFILTNAHLIQGEEPRISLDGQSFRIRGMVSDAENDVALVEIESTGKPAALKHALPSSASKPTGFSLTAPGLESISCANPECTKRKTGVSALDIGRYSDGPGLKNSTILKPEWAAPGAVPAGESGRFQKVSSLTFLKNQQEIDVQVSPGMSGSLVIDDDQFAGIPTQYNYYFKRTLIAPAHLYDELVAAYQDGKRGPQGPARFQVRNGLTYRVYGDGTSEANFITVTTGKGIYGDPGKGVYGDPGKGVYGDPGRCPGETAGSAGEKISHLASSSQTIAEALLHSDEAPNPTQVFSSAGIQPGLNFQGKPTLGFVVTRPGHQSVVLYGNVQSLQFLRDYAQELDVRILGMKPDFVELLKNKIALRFKAGRATERGAVKNAVVTSSDRRLWGADSAIVYNRSGTRIAVRLPSGEQGGPDEILSFALDKEGKLEGAKEFLPIVEATSSAGKRYYVDLRRMFFTDLTQTYSIPLSGGVSAYDFAHKSEGRELFQKGQDLGIDLRRIDDGAEMAITYDEFARPGE